MIENREQRKKSSLLRRRKIIIIVSVFLVIAFAIALYFVYDYVNNAIPYVDVDGTTYYIKPDKDGLWAMYDKEGNLLERESEFLYYVTENGTFVSVNEETGEYITRAIPDVSDGEIAGGYEKVLIFKYIEKAKIRSIEIHNQLDDYTFYRYNLKEMRQDDSSDFVLRGSPHLTTDKDAISALIVAAGYPLAASRVEEPVIKNGETGEIDLNEYGLAPEKRTRTELDEEGNEITVEYDYTPSYYIVTSTDGERFKMLIGDRLVNGGGYYAQYVDISGETEKPRNKVYVLGSSTETTLLAEAKTIITPNIVYPSSQSDYYDVTNFTVKAKDASGALKQLVTFSYVDLEERTGTVRGSRPYVFADETSKAYYPNYDRIDTCLRAFLDPNIIEIEVLAPSKKDRAEYGLMRAVLDENGNPVINDKNQQEYVYDSKYVVSFERTAKDDEGNKVKFLQTVYISDKNKDGNYYSYTTLEFLDNTQSSSISGITFDMICEIAGETFNFLNFDEHDWIYHKFLETGIVYATDLTVKTSDYSANFKLTTTKDGDNTATQIKGEGSDGKTADTFGMLKFTGADGNLWYVSQYDVKVYSQSGDEWTPASRKTATNAIGESVKYLENPIKDANGNAIYVNVNDVKIVYANGTSKTYVRYQTAIFKKVFASINSLAIVDDYDMTEEEEKALIADPSKYLATISITTDDEKTITAEFYSITARKAYIVVNGEGGFYVKTSDVNTIINNVVKFLNCEDIK